MNWAFHYFSLRTPHPSFSGEHPAIRSLVLISGLATGGAERVTVSFLRRLTGTETEALACTVTARHDGPLAAELSVAGVIRHDLCARRLADPAALLRLVHLLRRERFDLVHAHGQDASILGAGARFFTSVPLIITRHVLDEPSANWRQSMRARLALVAAHRADAIVAVSTEAAERLVEIGRLPHTAIRVIPNGIELERFKGPEITARGAQVRRELGFGPDDRFVLVPAVLRAGKGHEVLLAALPAIRARVPSARVVFSGSGEREAALRLQAKPHGNAVLFLGAREDIPELLSACDLVVLPSLAEALPTALMEAAAVGRPVVATRVGGTADLVEDGRTGLLVPAGGPAELADAMVALLTNAARARAFGEAARRRAHERFGIDLQVRRTLALWSEVVTGACR